MFSGREKELNKLSEMYKKDTFEFAVIYGRRRIGKTTLIEEFIKDKKSIFYTAIEGSEKQNIAALSKEVVRVKYKDENTELKFDSIDQILDSIYEIARNEKIIFVIDEYPYLAKAVDGVSSLLQKFIDKKFKQTNMLLILSGSSMSFMERQVMGHESPLYGRRTAQIKLEHFDYMDTAKFNKKLTNEQNALIYGITNGIPFYIEHFSNKLSIKENLINLLFDKNGLFYEEPNNLLKQELRDPSTYNAIIESIASGKSKLSEISTSVSIPTGSLTIYINNLISLGIIKKIAPVLEKVSKKYIYLIDDLFYKFWYTFVPNNINLIATSKIVNVYDEVVDSKLNNYMGKVFERICIEYLNFHCKDTPFIISEIGEWWGNSKKLKKQIQIDIVATSIDKKEAIFGSCKYTNDKVGLDEYYLLKEYAEEFNFKNKYYYLFSKSGFKNNLLKLEDDKCLRLVELNELYDI